MASTPRTHHRGRRSASTHRDWSERSTPETRPTARGQRRSRRYQRHAVLLALCPVAHFCMPCPTLGLPNGEASSSLSSCVAAATHPEGTLLAAALSTYLDSTCWWRRDGWNVVAMDYVNPLWRNDGNRASSNSLKQNAHGARITAQLGPPSRQSTNPAPEFWRHGPHVRRRQVVRISVDQDVPFGGSAIIVATHRTTHVDHFHQRETIREICSGIDVVEDERSWHATRRRVAAVGQTVAREERFAVADQPRCIANAKHLHTAFCERLPDRQVHIWHDVAGLRIPWSCHGGEHEIWSVGDDLAHGGLNPIKALRVRLSRPRNTGRSLS